MDGYDVFTLQCFSEKDKAEAKKDFSERGIKKLIPISLSAANPSQNAIYDAAKQAEKLNPKPVISSSSGTYQDNTVMVSFKTSNVSGSACRVWFSGTGKIERASSSASFDVSSIKSGDYIYRVCCYRNDSEYKVSDSCLSSEGTLQQGSATIPNRPSEAKNAPTTCSASCASPCGCNSSGSCVLPAKTEKCAGENLVKYFYCPNSSTPTPIEDGNYKKEFDFNNIACKKILEKEINPTCAPCGSDSSGNCIQPQKYGRCSKNYPGRYADFYACPNLPNPSDNPIMNMGKYNVQYTDGIDPRCPVTAPTAPTSQPVSTAPSSGSTVSPATPTVTKPTPTTPTITNPTSTVTSPTPVTASPAQTQPSTATAAPVAPKCDVSKCGVCGCLLDGSACAEPMSVSRCSANTPKQRVIFFTCANKPAPLDHPLLDLGVNRSEDESCTLYVPQSSLRTNLLIGSVDRMSDAIVNFLGKKLFGIEYTL